MRHLTTPARIQGVRYITDPITGRDYPIPAGGADDDPPADDPPADDPPADDPPSDDPDDDPEDTLGDAGKRALRAERRAKAAAEKRAKELEERLSAFEEAQKSEDEKALDEARKQAREEALAEAARTYAPQLAAARAEAMAADKTSDPTLAVAALGDLTRFVQEDGTVDTDAMSDALDDAIEKHPALTKDDATPSGGGPGGGPRPPASEGKPKDLKEALQRRLAGTRT